MQFTQEHDAIRRTMQQFIKNEINPFVDEWEREGIYPAHQVFKKMGESGAIGMFVARAHIVANINRHHWSCFILMDDHCQAIG